MSIIKYHNRIESNKDMLKLFAFAIILYVYIAKTPILFNKHIQYNIQVISISDLTCYLNC